MERERFALASAPLDTRQRQIAALNGLKILPGQAF
jgi:hypothetical protein